MISHFPLSQKDRNEAKQLLADIKVATSELKLLLSSQKQFLSVEECAEYTKLSTKYLYKLTHLKKIPHYKPNRKIYFKRDEVDLWLMSHRVEVEE